MAKGRMNFLSHEEIERIHEISLKMLEEIGISVESDSVSNMLLKNGCSESEDGKRILIPGDIVDSALSSVPKSILLAARDEKQDMRIPFYEKVYMACGGQGVYVKDLLTGESHSSSQDDLRKFMVVADNIPQIDFCWPMVGAVEKPNEIKGLVELQTCFLHTTKHIQGEALNAQEAVKMIEMASVLTGGRDELVKRPIFSSVQCPISPLTFDKGLVEAQVELAKASIPIVAMSAGMAGLTSPITLSGTIAQSNAENLASLVITQMAKKGAPFIYSSDSSPANMKSGSIDYGAFESTLMRTGCGNMGKFYNLPTMVGGAGLDSAGLSLGSIADGLHIMMLEALVPTDIGSGMGGIDQAAGASLEQMVADAWVWGLAREFVRSFETDDEAISMNTIREATVDGTYMNKSHTLTRFRTEFIATVHPELGTDRMGKVSTPGELLRRAKDKVDEILKIPRDPLISKDQAAEIELIIKSVSS